MNHPETLESVQCVICRRCGNTCASDADDCSRCGALNHTAPWERDSLNNSEAPVGRHPQRLRRVHVSSPYPSLQEEVLPRPTSTSRKHRPGLRPPAVITVIGLFIAAFAYTSTGGRFERASASQHVSASGTVMALSSSNSAGESETKPA